MKFSKTLIAVATSAFVMLAMAGCKTDEHKTEIPFDKEKAKVHLISLKKADEFKNTYSLAKQAVRLRCDSSAFDSQLNLPVAEMFNRDAIALLLNQEGADGIRIYYGTDSLGQVRLVLLPVDKNGKDIRKVLLDDRSITQKAATQVGGIEGGGQAVEVGQRCPTICN